MSCIAFHSTGELVAVTSGNQTFLWQWQASSAAEGGREDKDDSSVVVLMDSKRSQRCVAFKVLCLSSAWFPYIPPTRPLIGSPSLPPSLASLTSYPSPPFPSLHFLHPFKHSSLKATLNPPPPPLAQRSATHELFFVAETNAEIPPEPFPAMTHQAPPFTVQLFMWLLPPQVCSLRYPSLAKLDSSNASYRSSPHLISLQPSASHPTSCAAPLLLPYCHRTRRVI